MPFTTPGSTIRRGKTGSPPHTETLPLQKLGSTLPILTRRISELINDDCYLPEAAILGDHMKGMFLLALRLKT